MMMRLDVARQTVSSCLTKIFHTHTHTHTRTHIPSIKHNIHTHILTAGSKHRATPFLIVWVLLAL